MQDVIHHIEDDRAIVALKGSSHRDSAIKGLVVLGVLWVMTLEPMLSLQSKVLALQFTAATVSDTVSRLTRCAEQASDAASAHTQQ